MMWTIATTKKHNKCILSSKNKHIVSFTEDPVEKTPINKTNLWITGRKQEKILASAHEPILVDEDFNKEGKMPVIHHSIFNILKVCGYWTSVAAFLTAVVFIPPVFAPSVKVFIKDHLSTNMQIDIKYPRAEQLDWRL